MFKIYKHYYSFFWKYRLWFGLFVMSLIIAAVASSVLPYFYKLFVDAVVAGEYQILFGILVTYLGVRIIDEVGIQAAYYFGDKALLPAARDARIAVLEKIQQLDFAYHTSRSTGSLISAMKRGDGAFFQLFHNLNNQAFRVMISFLVMFAFFANLDWRVAAMITVTFLLNIFAMYFLLKANLRVRKEFNDAEDDISGLIVDNLINYETVKLFAKEKHEIKRLENTFVGWLKALWNFALSFRIMDSTIATIAISGMGLILFWGIFELKAGRFSVGEYVMVIGFLSAFFPRFFDLMYQVRNIAKHNVDIEKYLSVLDFDSQVKDPVKPIKPKQVFGAIGFNHVDFSYPDGKQGALQDFSLHINAGESVAFVGHSGAGKTTVTKLLLRFFDPDAGHIDLDGVDLKDMTKSELRQHIGVVPQEPILFNNTIAFNIAYGHPKATKKEIMKAIKMANLEDFIASLPDGLKTNVGERGVKLSGGQKQRLAIARMVLSNPQIIIFDEATSQLDSESEKKIQEAFWRVAKDKTTIIIAHRLSTVVNADRIIVMADGKIKEIGSHDQLYNQKDSLYKYFWSLQEKSEEL